MASAIEPIGWLNLCIALPVLLSVWALAGLWAWSTWAQRRSNLYVRVRRPEWLLLDLLLTAAFTSVICLQQILLATGHRLPCAFSHVATALYVAVHPWLLLWRGLQLWFVFSQAGGDRQQHRRMFQRLSQLLGVKMAVVALIATVTAAGVRGLCLSGWCDTECYWGTQWFVLLPLCAFRRAEMGLVWRSVRGISRVEHMDLLLEFRRVLTVTHRLNALALLWYCLADAGVIGRDPANQTVGSVLWLLAIGSKFVIIHVMPSFKFGYHPVLVRLIKITQILPTSMPAALPVSDAGLSIPVKPSIGRRVIQIKQSGASFATQADLEKALGNARQRTAALESEARERSVHVSGAGSTSLLPRRRNSSAYSGSGYEPPMVSGMQPPGLSPLTSLPVERRSSVRSPVSSVDSDTPRASLGVARRSVADVDSARVEELTPAELDMLTMNEVLGNKGGVLPDFTAFCQSLQCDHMVFFVQALRPYCRTSLNDFPRLVPFETLQRLWRTHLSPSSRSCVPLEDGLVQCLQRYCEPRNALPSSSSSNGSAGAAPLTIIEEEEFRNSLLDDTFREPLLEQASAAPADSSAFTVSLLLELACTQIELLLAEEALPLFKTFLHLTDLEYRDRRRRQAKEDEERQRQETELLDLLDEGGEPQFAPQKMQLPQTKPVEQRDRQDRTVVVPMATNLTLAPPTLLPLPALDDVSAGPEPPAANPPTRQHKPAP